MKRRQLFLLAYLLVFSGPLARLAAQWTALEVPSAWEEDPERRFTGYDGFAWYRAYVKVPRAWAGSRLLLVATKIDDVDEGFFNGHKIGANGSMPPLYGNPASDIRRPFVIDPDWVRFGEDNLIAWRVYDRGGKGGIIEGPVHLSRVNDAIDLSGRWLFRTGDSPAWAGWDAAPGSAKAKDEVKAFLRLTGDRSAGYRGVVPADIAGRRRMIQAVYDHFKGNTNTYALVKDKGDPKPPGEARKALRLSKGLAIDTVLAEPIVRQPLYVDFDARGRMWVTQYIQYPNPAGLKVLTWDNHLRKVFDQVPPPPPHRRPEERKFIGNDKITIHEDTNGDGIYDRHKVFVDGLNLATSTAIGNGGVWVMNPPYLLFYPDADQDDIPDGDPVVHLSGFGLEDTHSIANSLKWGPDGWLYGATGSTVTARVKVPLSPSKKRHVFFGQTIWRYHPRRHVFELFAQGGWNTFGVDFDDKGRVYSGTNGNLQAVYFVQDGYYQKNFGKHGPFTNPYTFGHFFGLPIKGEKVRLVHQWILYNSGAIPWLDGHLVGSNPLANKLHALRIEVDGSRFATYEIENPVTTDDKWFRPVHVTVGPDGAIYISDWYDARITHVDPRDNWDRDRGRIYRLRAKDARPHPPFDLRKKTTRQLVDLLGNRNQWFRRTAQRLLAQRRDTSVIPVLLARLTGADSQFALEALWAIHGLEAFDDSVALEALASPDPYLRLWSVRLLGDDKVALSPSVFRKVLALARQDTHPEVLSQLASTAQRLPVAQGLALVRNLTLRDAFAKDPYIPQQIWWALEAQISKAPNQALSLLNDPAFWQVPIFSGTLGERIARRFMADRSPENLTICARLLQTAPTSRDVKILIRGMEKALQGSAIEDLPPELDAAVANLWRHFPVDRELIQFALRMGSPEARLAARRFLTDPKQNTEDRIQVIQSLSQLRDVPAEPVLLDLALSQASEDLRLAALNALRRYHDNQIADSILAALPAMQGDLRLTAQRLLAGRPDWGRRLIAAVDSGKVSRESLSYDVLLLIRSRDDAKTNDRIRRHWGSLRQTSESKQKRMQQVRAAVKNGRGDPNRGKTTFEAVCGVCHRLKDAGRDIGPDLTGYERDNLDFLLTSIVDPSLGVREEFELVTLTLRQSADEDEATVITGFVTDVQEQNVSLRDLAGNTSVIAKVDIASQVRSPISVMPEGLLDGMTDQQIRDLFAFLQRP